MREARSSQCEVSLHMHARDTCRLLECTDTPIYTSFTLPEYCMHYALM